MQGVHTEYMYVLYSALVFCTLCKISLRITIIFLPQNDFAINMYNYHTFDVPWIVNVWDQHEVESTVHH